MKRMIPLMTALALSGCVSNTKTVKYEVPQGDATELNIKFNAHSRKGNSGIAIAVIYKEAETCKGPQLAAFIASGDTSKLRIKADEPLSLKLSSVMDGFSCHIYATFTPVSEVSYEATYHADYEKCSLKLHGLSNGKIIEAQLRQREKAKDSWSENPSYCK